MVRLVRREKVQHTKWNAMLKYKCLASRKSKTELVSDTPTSEHSARLPHLSQVKVSRCASWIEGQSGLQMGFGAAGLVHLQVGAPCAHKG